MANNDDVNIRVTATTQDLQAGMQKASESVARASMYMRTSLSGLGDIVERIKVPFLTFFALLEGGEMFKDAISSAATYGEEMAVLHEKTGMSVEDLSRLQYAANLSEVSFDALTLGLQKLARTMEEAASTKTSMAAQAFERLHIQITNGTGQLRSYNEILLELAQRFQTMPDGPTKAALAMDLFGRSGAALIPLLNQGKEGLSALEAEADRLGITMSEKDVAAAEEYDDAMKRLHAQSTAVERQLALGLMPALTQIASGFDEGAKAGEGFRAVGEAIGKVLETLVAATVTLVAWYHALGTTMKDLITMNFSSWWVQIKGDAQAVLETWKEVFSTVEQGSAKLRKGGGGGAPAVINPDDKAAQEQAIRAAEQHQLALVAIDKENADLEEKLGLTTAEQRAAQEEEFAQRIYDIKKAALEQILKLYDDEPKKQAEVRRQIAALADEQALDVTRSNNKATVEIAKQWDQTFQKVNDAFQKSLDAWTKGTMTLSTAIQAMMAGLLRQFIGYKAKEVEAHLAGEAAKKAATAEGVAARLAMEAAGALRSIALAFSTAIKTMAIHAGEMFTGMTAWLSQFLGPFAVPVALGLTVGAIATGAALMHSAAGGYDIPPGVNPVTQLHAQEMVLPKPYADVIRSMAGGGKGSGGDTYIIHAMDPRSFRQYVMDNRDHLADAVQRAHKDGRLDR